MIGPLLREARERHGVSQTRLARRARTSQAAISRIERGRVSPTMETARELFDLLGEELRVTAEPIDYGHDRSLLRANLELPPHERLRRQVAWANRVKSLQRDP